VPKRGCLAMAALMILAGSWSVFAFVLPRAWQRGGLGNLTPVGYVGFLLGLLVLVFALPRRVRLRTGLALLLVLALFFTLWPYWEGRSFPYHIGTDRLVAAVRPDGIGPVELCVYTLSGPVWVLGPPTHFAEPLVEGRISGFYAEHLSLRTRLFLLTWGLTFRRYSRVASAPHTSASAAGGDSGGHRGCRSRENAAPLRAGRRRALRPGSHPSQLAA
jgi:hypothetical protein